MRHTILLLASVLLLRIGHTNTQGTNHCLCNVQFEMLHYSYPKCLFQQPGSPPCDLPFFESGGECVETCLDFQFGNHTSGACEPCMFNHL